MPKVTGIVQNVRIDQEGGSIVLRFTAQTDDDERIPVEMRGEKMLGVLEPGDPFRLTTFTVTSTGGCIPRESRI